MRLFRALRLSAATLAVVLVSHAVLAQDVPDGRGEAAIDVADIENGGRMEPHKVAPGDCFARIAKKYGVSVADVLKANPGLDPAKLKVGQTVAIPSRRIPVACPPTLAEPPAAPGAGPTRQYQVAPGDTLAAIAARFGVGVADIEAVNERLDPRRLAVGQTLSIPAGPAPKETSVTVIKTLEQPPQAPLVTDFQ